MSLTDCTLENTPLLVVQHITCDAKVIDVYDADTITVAFAPWVKGQYFQHNVRLCGINAPEIRTTNKKEKALAIEAKEYVKQLLMGKIITLIIGENKDKYGRTSATVMYGDMNICDHLVAKGYAHTYSGGKRIAWFPEDDS